MEDSTASDSSTVWRSVLSRRRLMMSVGRGSIHCNNNPHARNHGLEETQAQVVSCFSCAGTHDHLGPPWHSMFSNIAHISH